MNVENQVAIVTGAADGIGWATARRLAAGGLSVVIADIRQNEALARAAELGKQYPGKRCPDNPHLGLECDVSNAGAVTATIQTVMQRFGRIDVLVNNAGIGDQAAATIDQSVEAFDKVLAVHVRGTFLLSQAAARVMLKQGSGAIVNLASIVALAGIPMRNAYSAAKAGIVGMTRSMACEWAAQGVRVNAVAPGYIRTALVDNMQAKGALDVAAIEARSPMARLGLPAEVAEAIAFLASPAASFITGTVLNVDGGWLAHGGTLAAIVPVVAA